jgi:hypothetical protein
MSSETNAVYMYSEGGNVIQYKSLFSPLTQTPPQYLTIINRSLTIQPFVSFSHSVPYTYYRSDCHQFHELHMQRATPIVRV